MSNRKLSDGSKVRDKTTLDWDAIRRRNAERLDDEILRGVDNPETRKRLQDRDQIALAQLDRSYLTAQESDRLFGRTQAPSTPKPKPVKKIAVKKITTQTIQPNQEYL